LLVVVIVVVVVVLLVVDFVLEVVLSRRLLCQSRLPQSIRVNLATAVQASLLYAAATWPALSATQQRKLAVRCYNPLRKAVNGAWSVDHQRRPMCWDEILAWSKRPSFQVAMSAARLRFSVKIKDAPPAMKALLHVAGQEWKKLVAGDLRDLQISLSAKVGDLPAPEVPRS
jgi:hypothetical protein